MSMWTYRVPIMHYCLDKSNEDSNLIQTQATFEFQHNDFKATLKMHLNVLCNNNVTLLHPLGILRMMGIGSGEVAFAGFYSVLKTFKFSKVQKAQLGPFFCMVMNFEMSEAKSRFSLSSWIGTNINSISGPHLRERKNTH